MPILNPTPEQQAIIAFGLNNPSQSLIIDAKAGTGKSTTLIDLIAKMSGSTLALAFNKAIVEELKVKAARDLSFERSLDVNISTAHAHGLSAFRRSGIKTTTQGGKVNFIVKDELASVSRDDDIHRNTRYISMLVSGMKASGFGLNNDQQEFYPLASGYAAEAGALALMEHHGWDQELEGSTTPDEIVEYAISVLLLSNMRTGVIDFDDMIYLPLLKNLPLPLYKHVLLDEAQDINATRRELAFRSIEPGGRIIAVGDPNQAIYGFTGADVQSLANIGKRAEAATLPLSICWRCSSSVIEKAQTIVPEIQPKPNAPEGQVVTVDWTQQDFLALPQPGDAILCRLNKPNVAAALGLIRRGIPARIEGKDLGKRILFHVQKAQPAYNHQDLGLTLLDLANYKEAELAKLFAKKRESAMDQLSDEIDCAALLIERVIEEQQAFSKDPERAAKWSGPADYRMLEAKVDSLFGDNISSSNIVTLASVHKSKGREWPKVFILGWRDYMPFHRAVKTGGWQLDQEYNLQYVAITRAEQVLVLVNGAQSAIEQGLHREAPRKQQETL